MPLVSLPLRWEALGWAQQVEEAVPPPPPCPQLLPVACEYLALLSLGEKPDGLDLYPLLQW